MYINEETDSCVISATILRFVYSIINYGTNGLGLTVLVACDFELFKTKTLFLVERSLKRSQWSVFKRESVLKMINTFNNGTSIQFWVFCCRWRFPPLRFPPASASCCSRLCCSRGVGGRWWLHRSCCHILCRLPRCLVPSSGPAARRQTKALLSKRTDCFLHGL